MDDQRYSVAQLAELGGVSRRTVRYYVQEGLLPPPLGVGRGDHYGRQHLEALLRVKALQEEGKPLDQIRQLLRSVTGVARAVQPVDMPRTPWVRLEIAPGLELHVASTRRIPPPGRLAELAAWCCRYFHERETQGGEHE